MSNELLNRINWFEIPVTNLDQAAALNAATLGFPIKREVFFGVPPAVFDTPRAPA